ncbi:hypothetical protein H6G06_06970 [Anabaena sphaerica FACHB-251]|uniref:Uncharacterized protein n=1 Tax=Anabaena sphaerica FACHB-251 TaxID=2692883 RepID=A0A926WHH1_9NOST|nr:hypothetical protein [Anabaena sphaerica]MBD2293233.1 hypothetical protein [Anabaena sphaerica FACHB-251]
MILSFGLASTLLIPEVASAQNIMNPDDSVQALLDANQLKIVGGYYDLDPGKVSLVS